jgi:hypothetical protein
MKKLSVDFSNDIYFLLDNEAKKKNLSKREIINLALQNYFEKNNFELTKLNIESLIKNAIRNITADEKFIDDLKIKIAKEFTKNT